MKPGDWVTMRSLPMDEVYVVDTAICGSITLKGIDCDAYPKSSFMPVDLRLVLTAEGVWEEWKERHGVR